ncbi:kynureninase [Pacificimonas flava]|uniref:Kynureninase n=1 Tax=Pacificimonas flava TaxID=1234595 RepID=M2S9E0_9SPHN|nr:Kynureninase [Pacificimonas flava]MBB5280432.1 kynureninase [Pacificimonas flava]
MTPGAFRDRFHLPKGIYMDGNSLGPLPLAAAERLRRTVDEEWGDSLIASWNTHGWMNAPERIGDLIAPLIGAGPDEVVVADSVSVNIFKLAAAALIARPDRHVIVSEPGNFPTDLYMIEGLRRLRPEVELRLVERGRVAEALDEDTALLMLTHVHYKTAEMFDMRALTKAAHAAGALALWDLSHSAGAVPVDLRGVGADFAVGCGYKYLNGGPGAPAFLYVAERHRNTLISPLSGWLGHEAPFAFDDDYRPAPGIRRWRAGTPPILSLSALEAGALLFADVDMTDLWTASQALSQRFVERVEATCPGLTLISPRDSAGRGSHVSFATENAYEIMQALIARGVVGDFRAPEALRFGFTPLYQKMEDMDAAADILAEILQAESWRAPEYANRNAVT